MSIFQYRQAFGGSAKAYQRFRSPYPPRVFRPFFRVLGRRAARVLDLGCGTGKSSEPIARAGYRVVGVDPDPRMLREARASAKKERLKLRYVRAAAERLPFGPGSFDAVAIGTAFHWFSTVKVLKGIRRVLLPGSPLFVFWQASARTQAKMRPELRSLFRRYRLKLVPERLLEPPYVVRKFREAGFSKVKVLRLPFTERFTLAQLVGRFCTTSAYHALPEAKKAPFAAELTEVYRSLLGKKKTLLRKRIAYACLGISPR